MDSFKPSDSEPQIRDTGVAVWAVYYDLASKGSTDQEVLEKYAALVPEDLTAVRDYIALVVKSRTCDRITGRPILPKDRLQHGRYYKGRCMNATIARWNAEEQCFYHWREKFQNIYIETIKYPTDETEPWWDVFNPIEELPSCKFEIPFDGNAEFAGNPDDLDEFSVKMWSRLSGYAGRKHRAVE